MKSERKISPWIISLAVAVSQLVATQVVTFILSLFLPGMGQDFGQKQPVFFGLLIGLSFSIGVFLMGWLALKMNWLNSPLRLGWRIICTLLGAFLPLLVAYLLYHEFTPGSPFFLASILVSIIGYHLPGWIKE